MAAGRGGRGGGRECRTRHRARGTVARACAAPHSDGPRVPSAPAHDMPRHAARHATPRGTPRRAPRHAARHATPRARTDQNLVARDDRRGVPPAAARRHATQPRAHPLPRADSVQEHVREHVAAAAEAAEQHHVVLRHRRERVAPARARNDVTRRKRRPLDRVRGPRHRARGGEGPKRVRGPATRRHSARGGPRRRLFAGRAAARSV